jgi:hypothetical protein
MMLLCSVEETTVWTLVDRFVAMCIVSASSSGVMRAVDIYMNQQGTE